MENQCDVRIKCLKSDRGWEFHFSFLLWICRHYSWNIIAYTSQQNGVAERKNRTLVEIINIALLCNSELTISVWGEAFFTACYISNRIQ